jgi:hypothetical protein
MRNNYCWDFSANHENLFKQKFYPNHQRPADSNHQSINNLNKRSPITHASESCTSASHNEGSTSCTNSSCSYNASANCTSNQSRDLANNNDDHDNDEKSVNKKTKKKKFYSNCTTLNIHRQANRSNHSCSNKQRATRLINISKKYLTLMVNFVDYLLFLVALVISFLYALEFFFFLFAFNHLTKYVYFFVFLFKSYKKGSGGNTNSAATTNNSNSGSAFGSGFMNFKNLLLTKRKKSASENELKKTFQQQLNPTNSNQVKDLQNDEDEALDDYILTKSAHNTINSNNINSNNTTSNSSATPLLSLYLIYLNESCCVEIYASQQNSTVKSILNQVNYFKIFNF